MNEIICGILKGKRKFYFTFDTKSKIVVMQPAKMSEYPSLIPESEFDDFSMPKERFNISGETNGRNYIEFIDIKLNSIGRGCFQAWVPAYVIGRANALSSIPKSNSIKKIIFRGKCIDRFFSSKKIVTAKRKDDYKSQIDIDYGKDTIETFKYKNLSFNFIPGGKTISNLKDTNIVLEMETALEIESSKVMDIKSIVELYKEVEKLFSFICYRRHVEFKNITLIETIPVIFEGKTKETTIRFELYISSTDEKYDLPKIGETMTLNNYIDKMPKLIKNVNENEHMLLSFPKDSLEAHLVDTSKYTCISSAFESEFDMLYPNFKSNKDANYQQVKDSLINFLVKQNDNKQNNRQTRKYYKNFIEYFKNFEGSLEEQMLYILKKYTYIVEPEINFYKQEYTNITFDNNLIAKAFADKRNNISHGKKLEKFRVLEILAYSIIRRINYAILLERSGFSDEQIKEIVEQVF